MSLDADRSPIDVGIHLWAQNTTWQEVRAAALRADALRADAAGYRYIWTWDHLYAIFGDPGITGAPLRVAESLQRYVDGGFDTITIELPAPYDPETVDRLPGEVVPLLRRASS